MARSRGGMVGVVGGEGGRGDTSCGGSSPRRVMICATGGGASLGANVRNVLRTSFR